MAKNLPAYLIQPTRAPALTLINGDGAMRDATDARRLRVLGWFGTLIPPDDALARAVAVHSG